MLEDRTVKLSVDGLIDSVESFSAKDLDLFAKDSKWIVVDSSNYFLSPGLIDCERGLPVVASGMADSVRQLTSMSTFSLLAPGHQHIMIGGPTNVRRASPPCS